MNDKEPSIESLVSAVEDLQSQLADVRKSEQKYRQWFENAPISLWEQDYSGVKARVDAIKQRHGQDLAAFFQARPDLVRELAGLVRVADVNEATLRLYKAKSKEDFLAGITKVYSRESYEGFVDNLMAVAEGRTRMVAERTHLAMDGELLDIELNWSAAPGYEDTYGRVLVSIIDISERKRAETALRESEEKYRLIADHMADTVWIMDMNMRFTYVSPSVERMYGVPVEEVMNRPVALSLTPESLETALKVFAEEMALEVQGIAEPDRVRILELEEYKSDGSTIWVETSMSFLRDENNEPAGVLGVSRDITDRKRAEAERDALEARTRQLQKAESLGRMAGAIAHHFNNQLQGVMGHLELAMIELPEEAGSVDSIKEAIKAAHRAATVSRQMLAYLGQTPSQRTTLDLSETCRLAIPLLQVGMPKQIALKTELPLSGPIIQASANQIEQVVANLFTNAWEAMAGSGGTIYLTVRTVSKADIPLGRCFPVDWQMDAGAVACIEVRDDGPGIPEEDMDKLFDPFFSTKFTGRGLGLSIALGIVRSHGGAIVVESHGGGGGANRGTGAAGARTRSRNMGSKVPLTGGDAAGTWSAFRVFLPLYVEAIAEPA